MKISLKSNLKFCQLILDEKYESQSFQVAWFSWPLIISGFGKEKTLRRTIRHLEKIFLSYAFQGNFIYILDKKHMPLARYKINES